MFTGGEDVHLEPHLYVEGSRRSNAELRQLGISELRLERNRGYYDYKISFKNLERGSWAFEDQDGSVYKVTCIRKGNHSVAYDSDRPRITKVTRF